MVEIYKQRKEQSLEARIAQLEEKVAKLERLVDNLAYKVEFGPTKF